MLFIFMLVPVAVSAVGTLFSLTGGMSFAAAAVAINGWQRHKGYKPGEGHFTERANNAYYGVRFDVSVDYDLSRNLGRLSTAAPRPFKKFVERSFDFTETEGEFLRDLISPALPVLEDLEAAIELVREQPGEEAMNLLYAVADQLAVTVVPVVRWLEQFPKSRIRKAS